MVRKSFNKEIGTVDHCKALSGNLRDIACKHWNPCDLALNRVWTELVELQQDEYQCRSLASTLSESASRYFFALCLRKINY